MAKSPIEDLVAANLNHYRLNTDFRHGVHFTALPTAFVTGFDKNAQLRTGSTTAWVTDTLGATASFLEFKGDGLSPFKRPLDRVERFLAVSGSRLLESQKRGSSGHSSGWRALLLVVFPADEIAAGINPARLKPPLGQMPASCRFRFEVRRGESQKERCAPTPHPLSPGFAWPNSSNPKQVVDSSGFLPGRSGNRRMMPSVICWNDSLDPLRSRKLIPTTVAPLAARLTPRERKRP